jgi:outer membrane biosynthesis protein TonB
VSLFLFYYSMIRILAIAAALVFTSATSFAGKKEKSAHTPEAQFAKLDSNSDGNLSLDEFKKLKSADKAHKPKAAAKKKAGKKAAAKPAKKAPKKAKKPTKKKKDNAKTKKPSKKKGDAKAKKADKGKGKKKHGKARKQ